MTTKLQKMAKELDTQFRDELARHMRETFDLDVQTHFNLMSMTLVTTRSDGKDFTPEQKAYVQGFENGYLSAMILVEKAAEK